MQQQLTGFIEFIRKQGVVGLAIGFILGGAVSKVVSSLVDNVINPIISLALGKVNLADKMMVMGDISLRWGAFLTTLIDFVVVAAVVYFGFKALKLDRLDLPKDSK